ncbi:hypothetical protein FUA48_01125 [Flavobacterium alkalisoli]|uniref:Transcription regulator BetR N-terminal domain-containing protein n=1 Tax=Flavobacterium alkalisoli TaxID=2602769 RepID=A0A5B9FN75_9FLAO|nr:hypothetical protein [Flavobacterium alkalisoli]QEE48225.1 hypothetical protein FUA48_01125 [Flavobacterium alkalisoli]
MNNQEKLLKTIRKQSKSSSLIDEVAGILNISYDAAHRRISQKSKFTIEETIALCHHYSLSMDLLFGGSDKVIVEKTSEIKTMEDLTGYFRESAQKLEAYKKLTDTIMYYSAKDIPLFHTISGTVLSKFKLYVWLNLLNGKQHESFENFTVNSSLLEHSNKLNEVYKSVQVNEIWNDTTINSTIQQIFYFFQSGLLSLSSATLICEDLKAILTEAEQKCSKNDSGYHLYYNELLLLNNNVLLSSVKQKSLFVPYTMLGYFITVDPDTCRNAEEYFSHQIRNSKSLNQSGTRDRKLFFNRMHQKIDFYLQKMNSELDFNF